MEEHVIRPMQIRDIPQAEEIDSLSFVTPWYKGSFSAELDNPVSISIVAETVQNRKIVGVLVAWLIVDELQIATLAVHPTARRLGISRKLMEYLMQYSREKGAKTAFLEVRAGNIAAQNLYQGFGFKVIDTRKNYYASEGEDALVMAWG